MKRQSRRGLSKLPVYNTNGDKPWSKRNQKIIDYSDPRRGRNAKWLTNHIGIDFIGRKKIKKFLFWPFNKPFARCRKKSIITVKRFERIGDYSHSDEKHICSQCQCRLFAGQGTHGDLYGLGFDTGHLGTGYCCKHENKYNREEARKAWREDLEMFQMVGDSQDRLNSSIELMALEKKEAEDSIKAREEFDLVVRTLNDFNAKVKDSELTEYIMGSLKKASDVTRMQLAIKIAESISKLNLANLKLDSDSYIHLDELKIRLPQMMDLGIKCFNRLSELMSTNCEDPVEKVTQEWIDGLRRIWQKTKTGIR